MLALILLPLLNITLFMGMFKEQDNVLNVAIFIMWFLGLLHFMAMFQSDDDLIKNTSAAWLRITVRTLIFITIVHSVYWGYFFVPALWAVAVIVLWARRREVDNRIKEIDNQS